MFGVLGYNHDPQDDSVPIEETLRVLEDMVRAGKIRFIGLSNETPWGVASFLKYAEQQNLARIASIQNPYNLLNRSYEIGLAEMSIREECGLLAYSPLAMGVLTGKYLNGARPAGARLTLFDRFQRYSNPRGTAAAARYIAVAKEHGLDPGAMSIAYILRQPFVTSVIIGATSLAQLEQNIAAKNLNLSDAVVKAIETIHTDIPNPCP
jgi:aryl-alcohol dehydrogenase-like predicted oxidoreductase